jgi:class 3 adenylate cyclase
MTQTRQLAAIMFTDIVGYTALMGNDEKKHLNYLIKTGRFKNQSLNNTMAGG